jgi:hypothetical protein
MQTIETIKELMKDSYPNQQYLFVCVNNKIYFELPSNTDKKIILPLVWNVIKKFIDNTVFYYEFDDDDDDELKKYI